VSVIVAVSVLGPVNSPLAVPAWHFRFTRPTVSSSLPSVVEVKPAFAPGPGDHSNLPVSSPSLFVVQMALA
jgi:hypothetical protein